MRQKGKHSKPPKNHSSKEIQDNTTQRKKYNETQEPDESKDMKERTLDRKDMAQGNLA